MKVASKVIPHPEKAHYGGEDAHFISSVGWGAIGVADGVGGWNDSGVSPAEYSRTFMETARKFLEGDINPEDAIPPATPSPKSRERPAWDGVASAGSADGIVGDAAAFEMDDASLAQALQKRQKQENGAAGESIGKQRETAPASSPGSTDPPAAQQSGDAVEQNGASAAAPSGRGQQGKVVGSAGDKEEEEEERRRQQEEEEEEERARQQQAERERERERQAQLALRTPLEALDIAHKRTRLPGSATACILRLDGEKGVLNAANLGDSGFLVIRGGSIVFTSPILQHFFDCPYQFGACPEYAEATDSVKDAEVYEVEVQEGDVVVLATDGLLDNCYPEEIAELAPKSAEQTMQAAEALAELASRHANDPEFESPYMEEAAQEGYDIPIWEKLFSASVKDGKFQLGKLRGGKIDDITVVVAYVEALRA